MMAQMSKLDKVIPTQSIIARYRELQAEGIPHADAVTRLAHEHDMAFADIHHIVMRDNGQAI